jgi:hypothetical protein
MTGNLSYYIGARVAENGYVRDRDRKFTEQETKPKAQVLAAWDRAMAMAIASIEEQSAEDWQKPYTAVREPVNGERFAILLRCAGHAYQRGGQLVYLSPELRKYRTLIPPI